MSTARPKFITFDCYGTLIDFRGAGRAAGLQLQADARVMEGFYESFRGYRLDEILGAGSRSTKCPQRGRAQLQGLERDVRPGDARGSMTRFPSWIPHLRARRPRQVAKESRSSSSRIR